MTVFHYIAANRELPIGTFEEKGKLVPIANLSEIVIKGLNFKKTKSNKYKNPTNINEQYMIVYEREEDFVSEIGVRTLDHDEPISGKFSNEYIYILHCPDKRESYRYLFRYIDQNLLVNESIEIYSCQFGDAKKPPDDSLQIRINLSDNQYSTHFGTFKLNPKRLYDDLCERFMLRERQFVVVTK